MSEINSPESHESHDHGICIARDLERNKRQLDALARVPNLPFELQDLIVEHCNLQSLSVLCKLNKAWHKRIVPLLWRHLDFVDAFSDNDRDEASRRFFVRCEIMCDSDPARFATLASYVQTLDLGRLLGINIVHGNSFNVFDYFDDHNDADKRCAFDIIAYFVNLESLSVYVKNWWGFGSDRASTSEALTKSLTKLKSVKVGGQMPPLILSGLLALGPQLRSIHLFNLIETPGQDNGPEPITFLSEEECKRLTNLETLHLCKFADLDGNNWDGDEQDNSDSESDTFKEFVSGMRWRFPREGEESVLEEWVMLLRHTSKTLRTLTLENRYLCGYEWDVYNGEFIEPGDTHPAEYGAVSIRQSQRYLFPVLSNQEWLALEKLTLVGMGSPEAVNEAVGHLKDRVRVEQKPTRFQMMGGDATPDEISTPVEFMEPGVPYSEAAE